MTALARRVCLSLHEARFCLDSASPNTSSTSFNLSSVFGNNVSGAPRKLAFNARPFVLCGLPLRPLPRNQRPNAKQTPQASNDTKLSLSTATCPQSLRKGSVPQRVFPCAQRLLPPLPICCPRKFRRPIQPQYQRHLCLPERRALCHFAS